MTDRTPPMTDKDDILAAEYVLGTLPDAQRREVAQRIELDGAFAAQVRLWETRFAAFNDDYGTETPPDVWDAIAAQLPPTARDRANAAADRQKKRGWTWLPAGLLGGVVTAGLALWFTLLAPVAPPPPAGPTLRAEIVAEDALVFVASYRDNQITLTRQGPAAPEGRDYQLWVIGADGVPLSLGVITGDEISLPADLAQGLTLAVSLEVAGGTTAPAPEGPVLAAAVLQET